MKTKDLFHSLSPNARILLIRLRSMGDCLLLTGPVHALKDEFPGYRVAVLVESRFAGCFDGNPDFDEVLAAGGKLSTAAKLLTRRFDAVVNLHGGPTSLAYACLTRGPRIGSQQHQYARLYHGLVPKPDSTAHTVESTMAALQWLGLRCSRAPALRYEFHPKEADRIQEKLKGRPYAVIHPASVMATKRWDPRRFAEVARDLARRDLGVVVTAGPGEESSARQVAREVNGTIILLGLTIPELAELIRGARIYIGNDSGPMHLAAAVGTPAVAVWGSSDSRRWRPWSVEHRVVQNPFECNPCPGYRCLVADSPLCIESVTVDQVNAAVRELLQGR
ncbi:MAG: glycosyltransferase family 9 protein [Acidobacteria bacterium]|nr:glycosyltransferase family 9 protein [Acidobacteriota bacterium]